MKPLKEKFGNREAESITPQDMERWLADNVDENEWEPATVNRYKALISLAYRLGIENGKVEKNPAKLVKRRRENNARIRFLSEDEEKRLRAVMRKDYAEHLPELDFALNTGVRCGEQYALMWDCVDLKNKVLTIRLSKNGEMRHLPINDVALAALVELRGRHKGNAVFVRKSGEPILAPRFWFEPAIEEAKIDDFTWHCLRHTFASRLVMKDVNLTTVRELMGHKSIQMTLRYAHLAPKHLAAAVAVLCEPSKATNSQKTSTDTKTDTSASEPDVSSTSSVQQLIALQAVSAQAGL
jgi:integrase